MQNKLLLQCTIHLKSRHKMYDHSKREARLAKHRTAYKKIAVSKV